jgi:hypothetical protein
VGKIGPGSSGSLKTEQGMRGANGSSVLPAYRN